MQREYKLRGVAFPQKLGPEVEAIMVCFVLLPLECLPRRN